VALAILVALLGLAHGIIVRPVLARFSAYREESARSLELLAGYRRLIASGPSLEVQLKAVRQRFSDNPPLLQGASETAIMADLQARVRAAVAQQGGRLTSLLSLPPAPEGGLTRIGLRIELESTLEGLVAMAQALQSAAHIFYLGKVAIRAAGAPGRDGAPASLNVQMEVYGYATEGPPA
jgi:hypothetical protein